MLFATRDIKQGEPLTVDFFKWMKNESVKNKTLKRWRGDVSENQVSLSQNSKPDVSAGIDAEILQIQSDSLESPVMDKVSNELGGRDS